MKYLLITVFLYCAATVSAQETLLEQIEQNNTGLATLRKQAEACKIANKTGIYPENPEVEYHYLRGNSYAPGNRTDFSAIQRFDFPTSYYYKKRIADAQNRQTDLKYLAARKDVLLEARKLGVRLIYYNAMSKESAKRLQQAQQMAEAYRLRLEKGDASILDLNKAKINLLNVKKEHETALVERNFLLAELTRLNGGIPVDFTLSEFPETALPYPFESWYEDQQVKNLDLQYLAKKTDLSLESGKLQRALNLPKISAGYMSEKVLTEQFQGITIGLSIPLWENKNTVRKIKAQTLAHREAEIDAAIRFRNTSEALYQKTLHLKSILDDYRNNALSDNMLPLLNKALESGEIALIDYLMESSIYYEVINNRLETERELHLTIAELMQWN